MVYQHLPTPGNTPDGTRARQRPPARTRPKRVRARAIARIAGRFIRAFRTRG